jgi:hypothetical protein
MGGKERPGRIVSSRSAFPQSPLDCSSLKYSPPDNACSDCEAVRCELCFGDLGRMITIYNASRGEMLAFSLAAGADESIFSLRPR